MKPENGEIVIDFQKGTTEDLMAIQELCPFCSGLKEESLLSEMHSHNFLVFLASEYGSIFDYQVHELNRKQKIGLSWAIYHKLSEGCIAYESCDYLYRRQGGH